MSTDDSDEDKPTRDSKGRWLPGHCPNREGRPKKVRAPEYDPGDIFFFGRTVVDIRANGHMETMDRRTALMNKMFESAMKGKTSMQRFMYKEFEKNDERLAGGSLRYERLMMDWIINNPDFRSPDYDMPIEVDLEIRSLRNLLINYFGDSYSLDGNSDGSDGNDDDC